jgi:drug/metabolite transporter (DMT)-like permease
MIAQLKFFVRYTLPFFTVYFGGFLLAAVCVFFVIRKWDQPRTARRLLVAAAALALAQIVVWMFIVESGNGV